MSDLPPVRQRVISLTACSKVSSVAEVHLELCLAFFVGISIDNYYILLQTAFYTLISSDKNQKILKLGFAEMNGDNPIFTKLQCSSKSN